MPANPKLAFPNPAATLPGEADILANVLADLSDDNAKLVYADWLEERDDPRGPLLREFVTAYRAGKKLPAVKAAPKPWRDLVGIALCARIRALELTEHANVILRLARPVLNIRSVRVPETALIVGESKFGGRPDLPPRAKWPTWYKEPLAFLGQFSLECLSGSVVCRELPDAGVLSVFSAHDESGEAVDPDDARSWRVCHFPHVSGLERREFPEELDDESQFRPCRLSFTETLSLPDNDSPWIAESPFAVGEEAYERYTQLYQALIMGGSCILGYATGIQSDVHEKKNVRHLLTIDSDDNAGWGWGDNGMAYFMINESYLQNRRFDHVRYEMQCA